MLLLMEKLNFNAAAAGICGWSRVLGHHTGALSSLQCVQAAV